jgi:uncharacterized protein YcfJ
MNRSLIFGIALGAIAVTAAGAYAGFRTISDNPSAEVLKVEPLTRTVQAARQVCTDQVVSHEAPTSDPNRIAGSVAGAVVGGVLGSQIGGGSGQKAATVAGAAAGGYAGNQVQKQMQEGNRVESIEQRCETVYDSRQQADGFQVSYLLDGQQGVVRTDRAPGRRIPVVNGQLDLSSLNDRN